MVVAGGDDLFGGEGDDAVFLGEWGADGSRGRVCRVSTACGRRGEVCSLLLPQAGRLRAPASTRVGGREFPEQRRLRLALGIRPLPLQLPQNLPRPQCQRLHPHPQKRRLPLLRRHLLPPRNNPPLRRALPKTQATLRPRPFKDRGTFPPLLPCLETRGAL